MHRTSVRTPIPPSFSRGPLRRTPFHVKPSSPVRQPPSRGVMVVESGRGTGRSRGRDRVRPLASLPAPRFCRASSWTACLPKSHGPSSRIAPRLGSGRRQVERSRSGPSRSLHHSQGSELLQQHRPSSTCDPRRPDSGQVVPAPSGLCVVARDLGLFRSASAFFGCHLERRSNEISSAAPEPRWPLRCRPGDSRSPTWPLTSVSREI